VKTNKGIIDSLLAYTLWGVFPIYFKFLHSVPADQIVAHRIVWSFLLLMAVIGVRRELREYRAIVTGRNFLIYLGAGLLLAANWGIYVWGVTSGRVVEASLGYFINPLVSVLLGVIFLHETLRPLQWVPVGLAAAGVIYLAVSLGQLPWLSLALAFTFGFYGLIKKMAPLGSLQGLSLETMSIFLPAAGYLIYTQVNGTGVFGHTTLLVNLLLLLSGVITVIPLLLFASGARSVPLTTLGLLQYIAPTLQFLSGVLLFGEPFTHQRLIGFGLVWLALIVFSLENLNARRLAVNPDV
jgi:chloramphenicol-sensitive protein RarD